MPAFTHAYFGDVPQDHEAYTAISALRNENIVQGFSENGKLIFKPNQEVTRTEFLKMAYLAEAKRNPKHFRSWEAPELFPFDNLKSISTDPACFNDFQSLRRRPKVPEWFEVYACWGKVQGLVKGYEGGNFYPLRTVNFAEAAKILIETSGQPVAGEDKFEHWAQGYIEALNTQRIIPSSIETAGQPLNRAMAAQLIYNYNQADFEVLQNQPSNALIWNGQEYVLFENLGIVGPYYQLLKRGGEIYYTYLFNLDGTSHNYKKLEDADIESFQTYQYYDQHTIYSGDLKYIMAGVATDEFSVLNSKLNPIEGSAGGPFQFFEETFQVIPDNYIGYGRDDKYVYLINCYEGCWPEILPGSNADDFEAIGNGFSRSGDQYYYLSQIIKLPINVDNLEFLTPVLGKQGDQVYYFQPDLGEGWQIRELDYLGKINLYGKGNTSDIDYDEYYMSDGKSVFLLKSGLFQKIEGADVSTFRLIGSEGKSLFAIDGTAIYWSGNPVTQSATESFEVLGDAFFLYHPYKIGHYVSDGQKIYLVSCWNECDTAEVPVGPNGKSFEHVGEGYGLDDARAYYAGKPLEIDRATINYLGQGYLKDKDHVYYPGYFSRDEVAIEITGADAQSFELSLPNNQDLFCTLPFAKDVKNLYLGSRVMKAVDSQNGLSLPGVPFADIEDVDYGSFELLDENGFFFKDKNGFYRVNLLENSCLSDSWEKLEKVDPDSFEAFKPHYYSSQGQVYFDVLLSQADEATFESLVKTFNNSVDLKHSYIAKDANFAYYKEDVIPLDIDVASFEYDHEKKLLQDKNRQYTLDEIEKILEECAYEYAPACGQLKEGEQSFRNSCLAKKEGSITIVDGLCTDQEKTWEQACLAERGTWIPESNYCRAYDSSFEEQTCTEIGGKRYNDCGSGCSPYSDSDVCPSVCIPVCFF